MRNEKQPTRSSGSLRSEGALLREKEHGRRMRKLVPLLIFGLIGVFIARQEIPAFSNWVDRLIDANAWTAAEACRAAALAATGNPGFARLTDNGKTEATSAGYFVGDVEYAVLGADGEQIEYTFSCNVSPGGEVISISGADDVPAAGVMPMVEQ